MKEEQKSKEQLLYNAIFPEDQDPNYINYGYFIGRNKTSLYKLKATLNESDLNPILICDGNNENTSTPSLWKHLPIYGVLNF
jgi:hypothetical protein